MAFFRIYSKSLKSTDFYGAYEVCPNHHKFTLYEYLMSFISIPCEYVCIYEIHFQIHLRKKCHKTEALIYTRMS